MKARGAVKPHKTDVTDEPWDAGENVKCIPADADEAILRAVFAWIPDGDSPSKSDCKFPHHMVSEDGKPGAANLAALANGFARLDQSDLSGKDRDGVYAHLAKHYQDAGREPPERALVADVLTSAENGRGARGNRKRECRTQVFPAEFRVERRASGRALIVGHAAVFDTPTEFWWGDQEKIRGGAFKKTIRESDIRALFNHDPNFVLGRNRAGTLRLWEDETGLAVEIDAPDTQTIADLVLSPMERGDIDQMSFSFEVIKQEFEDIGDGRVLRTLVEVKLWDVAVVTFPQYPETDAEVLRSMFARAGVDHRLMPILLRSRSGAPLTDEERDILTATRAALDSLIPAAEPAPGGGHSPEEPVKGTLVDQPSLKRQREIGIERERLALRRRHRRLTA